MEMIKNIITAVGCDLRTRGGTDTLWRNRFFNKKR